MKGGGITFDELINHIQWDNTNGIHFWKNYGNNINEGDKIISVLDLQGSKIIHAPVLSMKFSEAFMELSNLSFFIEIQKDNGNTITMLISKQSRWM